MASSFARPPLDLPIMNIPSATAAAMQPAGTVRDQMTVSVMKMEQDQVEAEGEAAQQLMTSAAEVQETGTGGNLDVTA